MLFVKGRKGNLCGLTLIVPVYAFLTLRLRAADDWREDKGETR